MKSIGVVEGFFGPQWPDQDRKGYAEFLAQSGGGFYIYAPKQDPHLRKAWREEWSQEYISKLQQLCDHFQSHKISFGVGFSPFGLGTILTEDDKFHLEEKLGILNDLKIDMLGLFFDDMPTNDNLARTQIESWQVISKHFKNKIIFCPTYYSYDPILEKVFGKKPDNYLEEIAVNLPSEVSIAWTGPKVISPEIDKPHLREVASLLKRKPFIWENLYANDGPRNCKFIKIKPFTGRNHQTISEAEAFAFNMMNQPQLSKIVFLASRFTMEDSMEAEAAFQKSLSELTSAEFREFFNTNRIVLSSSLDAISDEQKEIMKSNLSHMTDEAAGEITDWLNGKYNVGSECLTD